MYNPVLLLVFVSFMTREGESIRCFICDSKTNPGCADPVRVAKEMNVTRCRYEVIKNPYNHGIYNRDELVSYNCLKYDIIENNNKTVVRECTRTKTRVFDPCNQIKAIIESASSITRSVIKVESCNLCSQDNCNAAVSTSLSSAVNSISLACLVTFLARFGI